MRDSDFWKTFASIHVILWKKLIQIGLDMSLVIGVKDSQKSPNQ